MQLGEFIDILKVSPKKVARHLAMVGWDLYSELPAHEMIERYWKAEPENCPHVRKLIDFFNQVRHWFFFQNTIKL